MNYGNHGRDLLLELKRSSGQVGGRGRSAPALPAYNDRLVRACLEDLQVHVLALQDQVQAASTSSSSAASTTGGGGVLGTNDSSEKQQQQQDKVSTNVRPSLLLQKAAIDRNKRCLLAYHQARCQAIAEAYWKNADLGGGSKSNSSNSNATVSSNLSPAEDEFRRRYNEIVQKYTADLAGGSGVLDDDLRSHLHPPIQPVSMVQVRVLRGATNNNAAADAATTDGPILLESGQTVHLRPGALHYLLFSDVESMIRDGTMELLSTEEEENQPQNALLRG